MQRAYMVNSLRYYIDLVEAAEKMVIPEVLYHATCEPRLDSILRNGLGANVLAKNWDDSKDGVVYLAVDPDIAESYAETSENVPEEYLDSIVILEINTRLLDINKFSIDQNVLDNDGSTIEYEGVIPPLAIKVLR